MKRRLILLFIFSFILIINIFSQENPLDISQAQKEIDEYGVPTISSVDQMGKKCDDYYDKGLWKEAAVAYELYAKNANWIANLISSGLDPYYSASYDDKKKFPYSELSPLVKFETKANYYKNERNKAILRLGICYFKLADNKTALPYILKALDLIPIDNKEHWKEARDILYQIIQY